METTHRLILELYPFGIVQTIVHYGNVYGRDVDLFVILNDNSQFDNFQINHIDISTIGNVWLPMLSTYLDPILVEPILKGRLMYGVSLENWKNVILNKDASEDTVAYLLECSDIFLNYVAIHLSQGRKTDALMTMYFAVSYIYYALYYSQNKKAVVFSEVITQSNAVFLRQIRDLVKDKDSVVGILTIESFLAKSRALLTRCYLYDKLIQI
ncbi:hypothetical protein HN670_02635 [bacterium]|jgi:hypothetical protein|nr:hypothetical protein [Candidatus Komeilibacteria bacterium]MBT7553342.1 hypothetical protein [bacterium]